jgi:hypothetical protein
VDGVVVDLIDRDFDEVLAWTAQAEQGRFEIQREVGYVAGIATYVLAGELALGEVLHGELPRPAIAPQLRRAAPPRCVAWPQGRWTSAARMPAGATGSRRWLAAAGVWALNEKRLVERAELDAAQGLLDGMDVQQVGRSMSELHDLPAWR